MREEEQTPLPPLAVGGVGRSGEVGAELLEHPGGHIVPMDERAMNAYANAMR